MVAGAERVQAGPVRMRSGIGEGDGEVHDPEVQVAPRSRPHNGLGAPRARPPERSGDRGAPRAKAKGGPRGRSPRIVKRATGAPAGAAGGAGGPSPQTPPRAPRPPPPERSGDRGPPRAKAKGGPRGRSPPDLFGQ